MTTFYKHISILVVLSIVSAWYWPLSVAAQSVMTSNTYKMESDSINVAGVRSSSLTYSIEDTAGEVATGRSHSSAYKLFEAGYQGMRTDIGTTTPPTQPTGLTATGLTSQSIELSWTASTGTLGVARYRIYRDGVLIDDIASYPTAYVDSTGLSASTQYSYNVSALDDDNNESEWSATTTATTLAAGTTSRPTSRRFPQVTGLSIIPANNSAIVLFGSTLPAKAEISWSLDGNTVEGTLSEDTLSSTHQFIITELRSGTPYVLKIVLTGSGLTGGLENIPFRTLSMPTTIAPPNVSNFKIIPGENALNLSWNNPPQALQVRILRSTDFYVSSPDGGDVVFEGNAESFVDSDVTPGKNYYYTIFVEDQSHNFSSGVVGAGKIVLPGEIPSEVPPIENVPIATNVDPAIAALELKDFLFIQHGDSISVKDDTIHLNANENLTVALKYYRVPPVLKTIAVSLSTLDENPETFTFILRVNRDKTRYEATIAPLNVTKNYKIKITIVDYKNQGLKKISGAVKVGESLFGISTTRARNFGLAGFGFLALVVLVWRNRNSKRKNKEVLYPAPLPS